MTPIKYSYYELEGDVAIVYDKEGNKTDTVYFDSLMDSWVDNALERGFLVKDN